MIYEWFTEDTKRIVLDYIDNLYNTESSTGSISAGTYIMKVILFNIKGVHYTIIISPDDSIKYVMDLTELDNLKPFILQQIRDSKLELVLKK